MNSEDIIKSNELIADFMGCEKVVDNDRVYFKGEFLKPFIEYFFTRNKTLKFHSDWNWLMPVVKRIFETLKGNVEDNSFRLEYKIKESLNNIDINKTWNWVVEYIKWRTGNTLEVVINEDFVTAKEINPLGVEPDEDDFDRYPLPICFDPEDEKRELWRRKKMIEDKWEEAEENLKTFEIITITAKNGIILEGEQVKDYFTKFSPEEKYKAEIISDGKINVLLN